MFILLVLAFRKRNEKIACDKNCVQQKAWMTCIHHLGEGVPGWNYVLEMQVDGTINLMWIIVNGRL